MDKQIKSIIAEAKQKGFKVEEKGNAILITNKNGQISVIEIEQEEASTEIKTKSNQRIVKCLDGKERAIAVHTNGRISYENVKNGKIFGTRYCINTKEFPVVTESHSFFKYKKELPKWITREMVVNLIDEITGK